MKRFLAILLLGCSCLAAGAFPQKPAIEGPVNDLAGLLNGAQILELQHMLVDFADSSSNQICVVTVNSLEGMAASQFAIKIGQDWKVGSSDFNNGIVFLVKPRIGSESGEVFIAVGRGLEGAIPDIYAHRIVNDVVIPHLARGDYYSGIREGCITLMKYASGEYSIEKDYGEDDEEILAAILTLLIIVAVIIFLVRRSKKGGNGGNWGGGGRYDGPIVFISPGRSNSGFGSGGGFSGGFHGGFGGGSFGGGGAGGRF